MSPIAKEWQANPPAVPLDPSSPKRFARPALSEETMAVGGAPSASSVGAGSETPKDVDEVKQVIPDEVAVVGGSSDQLSKEPLVACDKGEIQTGDDGDEDLFHATAEPVTRKQQFAERDALKKEMKKTEEPHPEEGVPDKKTAKKNAQASKKAQAKAKAKAEAKKAAEKAKKEAEKAKKKAKKEAEKAKKEAEKAKKKAKKAEGKTRATKNGQKKRKQLEESQPSAENHENVSAVPENPPAPSPVPAEDVVMADGSGSSAPALKVPAGSGSSAASNAADDGLDDAKEDERKTFARRFRPSRSDPASRFDSLKNTFKKHLAGRFNKESTMEAQCCFFSPVYFSAAFNNSPIPPHYMSYWYMPYSLLRGGVLELLHEAAQECFQPCVQLRLLL
jgi:flagellar biosynthesis GTPase FlhF